VESGETTTDHAYRCGSPVTRPLKRLAAAASERVRSGGGEAVSESHHARWDAEADRLHRGPTCSCGDSYRPTGSSRPERQITDQSPRRPVDECADPTSVCRRLLVPRPHERPHARVVVIAFTRFCGKTQQSLCSCRGHSAETCHAYSRRSSGPEDPRPWTLAHRIQRRIRCTKSCG
jgi:hypothetical protein